jgi:hypothetical protein
MSRHASRMAALCFTGVHSPLLKLARVFMRLDHVARFIVNADHRIM